MTNGINSKERFEAEKYSNESRMWQVYLYINDDFYPMTYETAAFLGLTQGEFRELAVQHYMHEGKFFWSQGMAKRAIDKFIEPHRTAYLLRGGVPDPIRAESEKYTVTFTANYGYAVPMA